MTILGYQPIKKGLQQGKIRVYDGFDRPDEPLGNADTGHTWITPEGVWVVKDKTLKLDSAGSGRERALIKTGLYNGVISATLKKLKTNHRLVFRYVDRNNEFQMYFDTTKLRLGKRMANVLTTIAEYAVSAGNDINLKIKFLDNDITCYLNEQVILSVTTDGSYLSDIHGVGSDTTLLNYDNFKVEAI
jgi:hypothetical protein